MRRIVHISDVLDYKACRRRWSWASRIRKNLQSAAPYAPFFVGSGVHFCKEQLTSDGLPPVLALSMYLRKELAERKKSPIWRDEVPEVRQQVKMIRALMDQYQAWARMNRGPFADDNLDYLAHEVRFDDGNEADWPAVRLEVDGVPLQPEVWLAGRFDGLARRRSDGTVWLTEDKTCRGIEERSKLLPHDEQATAYCYAAGQLFGTPVEGVIYTLMRKKVAARPRPVRGGGLSRDKRIDTSPEIYREAILQHHGPVSEGWIHANYGEVLRYIEDFNEPFVARVAIKRTPKQVELYIRELHQTALEMYNENTPLIANRTWACPKCIFRAPCLARDKGEEDAVATILATQYRPRQRDASFTEPEEV